MTTLLQVTAIWFEEKVVTDLPADRQEEAQCGDRDKHDNQPVTEGNDRREGPGYRGQLK